MGILSSDSTLNQGEHHLLCHHHTILRFDIFPHANLHDGKVDAIVAERVAGWRFPEYTRAVLTGNLPEVEGIHYLQSGQVELIPHREMRVPVQLDGDAMGKLPAKVSVQPLGLQIVIPEP